MKNNKDDFYVYCLIDPNNNEPFYVGNGIGWTVLAFCRLSLDYSVHHRIPHLDKEKRICKTQKTVALIIIGHGSAGRWISILPFG